MASLTPEQEQRYEAARDDGDSHAVAMNKARRGPGTKPLSADAQKSWDRRARLAAQHQGTIKSETPDEIVVTFPHYTRAAAFFDEMATRGFVVKQPRIGGDVHVLRKEEDYG